MAPRLTKRSKKPTSKSSVPLTKDPSMQPALKFTPRNASAARIDPIVPMSRKGFSAMIAELCEQFKIDMETAVIKLDIKKIAERNVAAAASATQNAMKACDKKRQHDMTIKQRQEELMNICTVIDDGATSIATFINDCLKRMSDAEKKSTQVLNSIIIEHRSKMEKEMKQLIDAQ